MKVFISYSVADRDLVQQVAHEIKMHAQPFFWDQNKEPGEDAWRTIFGWIDAADCLIAIITDKTVKRGESINQEIGYAKGKDKLVIPVVSSEVDTGRLGCLNGVTYIELKNGNLSEVIDSLKQKLVATNQAKLEKQGWAIVAVMALVMLAMSGGGK